MPAIVLTVLKYAFLVLLYFFVYRTVKTVVVDVRGERPARRPKEPRAARRPRAARTGKGRAPAVVVVRDDRGAKLGRHKLGAALEIGRAEGSDIRPDDTYLSQQHARLFTRNGAWFIEDLGSTNGTYLNRRRITAPAEVHAGDEVRVGKTILELRR